MRKLFAVIVLLFVSLSVFLTPVFAAVEDTPILIDYALPYPGILPDSPIYFVKVARDKVVRFLIVSNVSKSFYSLLLSDKRLAAGQILIDTRKTSLGVTTIASGEEYFSGAVELATKAKADGLEISELIAKLSVAVVKHQEVISNLLPKVTDDEKVTLGRSYTSSQNSQNRVQDLMKK